MVASTADAVASVAMIEFDAFVDDDDAAGATAATTKAEAIVEVKGGCDGGADAKQKLKEKAVGNVLTVMIAQPLLDERAPRLPVTVVVVLLALPSRPK